MLFLFWVAVTILIIHHLLKREKDMGKLKGKLVRGKIKIKTKNK